MRRSAIVVALCFAGVTGLAAQASKIKPEVRPFAGAVFPIGEYRNLFVDAPMVGIATALELQPSVHVQASFTWIPSQNNYFVAQDNVNIFQYTVGAELGFVEPLAGRWELRPFIGMGLGARTFAFQGIGLADKTCFAGYGAMGAEFQLARTALRLEGRQNVFCYRSPIAGVPSKTRTDLGLSLGIAYHLR